MGKPETLTLTLALLIATCIVAIDVAAQPTWSFDIRAQPAELYPGEWGMLTVNITNMDCQSDLKISEYTYELEDVHEDVLEGILARADELNQSRQIENFEWITKSVKGCGGDLYYTGELKLYGVCKGRAITIKKSSLWFPFKSTTRTYIFENETEIRLEAFDRVRYILEGVHPESSALIEFRVYVPPDIPPEDFKAIPNLDLRVDYPGWIEYTLQGLKIQEADKVKINPYRSFNLTITDWDGAEPIAGAKVIIRRLIHYYDKREYVTPENGTITIHRLREGKYEVRVYWNSTTYRQDVNLVYIGQPSAYELSKGALKTHVYSFRVEAIDLEERPINGATIILDGVEKEASQGEAVFQLVPEGNHSIEAYHRGVKIHEGWIWVGYHPTISPAKPITSKILKLQVADLLVQAMDAGGNPVGAEFKVEGPTPETSLENTYSRTGFLNLSQVPVIEYRVEAANESKAFDNVARAEGYFKPGRLESLKLPIYSVKLHAVSNSGNPIQGVSIRLESTSSKTDEEGVATFAGIPAGAYRITAKWLGLKVYEGKIDVKGNVEQELKLQIYDINLKPVTADGKPIKITYHLRDPAGREFEGRYVDEISAEQVPNGVCHLAIYLGEDLIEEGNYEAKELAEQGELKLPIAELKISVRWRDGRGLEHARVKVIDPEGRKSEAVTDSKGAASLGIKGFGNYKLLVYYPSSDMIIINKDMSWRGEAVSIELEKAMVTVKVLDASGKPVEGAQVTVSHMGVPLGYGKTGGDGTVVLEVLKLPIYEARAFYKGREAKAGAAPNGFVELKLEGSEWRAAEFIINPLTITILAAAIIAAVAIPKILMKVSEKVREEEV